MAEWSNAGEGSIRDGIKVSKECKGKSKGIQHSGKKPRGFYTVALLFRMDQS